MEQLVARQNNTPALLMAHNGLSKLLKNSWPWLLGGVVDAPRLLSRLCEIYRDGLDQASKLRRIILSLKTLSTCPFPSRRLPLPPHQ